MNKKLSIVFTLFLASNMLFVIVPACEAVPTPTVPEFTVKIIDSTYSVTTKDPYTGADVTQQHSNNSIQVTIKNQALSDSTHQIYYNVRTRPHFEGNWTELYSVVDAPNAPYNWDTKTWTYSKYLSHNTPPQSNNAFTVVTIALGESGNYLFTHLPPNAQVDFQVEAIVGHDSQVWAIQHPFTPEYGGYYE